MSLVRAACPIWLFDDLTGNLLNDTYYVFFLTNDLPYTWQTVYQDPYGNVEWPNPLQVQPNGALPNNLYFNPNLVYRIEIRQGDSTLSPLIGNPIENFVPNGSNSIVTNSAFPTASNLIVNPQFADIYFYNNLEAPSITFTTAGTYNIAPGWQLILAGTGTTTVTQVEINGVSSTGAPIIQGNPPYAMTFNSNGWSSATLQQTLPNNGAIFANGSIAFYMLAASAISTQNVSITYAPSTGGTVTQLFPVTAGALTPYSKVKNVGGSTNSSVGFAAYVNINIALPPTGTVTLSNIQVLGQTYQFPSQSVDSIVSPVFQETTYPQQVAEEFYVYRDALKYKPIPSYLVGWDFPLNPAQTGSSVSLAALGAGLSQYVWDQTIAFQTVANALAFQRDATGGLNISCTANTSFAIIQYLPQAQAREILSQRNSIQLNGNTNNANVNGTVSLWWTTNASLPNMLTNTSLVSSIASGVPTCAAGWTQVTNNNTPVPSLPFTMTTTASPINFTGFDASATAAKTSATFMAIVITFDTMPSTNNLSINYCSLVGGDIAVRPSPQTPDEVLRECQYYYEQSYAPGIVPGVSTSNGEIVFAIPLLLNAGNWSLRRQPFSFNYKQTKRVVPTMTWYNPSVALPGANSVGFVYMAINNGVTAITSAPVAITDWKTAGVFLGQTVDSISLINGNTNEVASSAANLGYAGFMSFHYTADARLGII